MENIFAALRTKDTEDLTWEFVSTPLIDECNAKHDTDRKDKKSGNCKQSRSQAGKQRRPRNDGDGSSSDESINGDMEEVVKVPAAEL